MITEDEAFDRLVAACPSFLASTDLDAYVDAFEDVGAPDRYVRTSALALHLVDLIAAGHAGDAAEALAEVEPVLDDGDDDARDLVTLGLIESLQNVVSHDDVPVDTAAVRDLLGDRAVRVWDEHDELWRDASRWRHGGPRVDRDDYETITDPDLRRYFRSHKRHMGDGVLIGASDIVHYQTELRDASALHPGRRGRFPWAALVVGVAIALALVIAVYR